MIFQNFNPDIENNFIHRLLNEAWIQAKEIYPDAKFHFLNKYKLQFYKTLYNIFHVLDWKMPTLKNNKETDYYIFFLGPDFGKLIYPKLMGFNIKPVMMDAWEFYHNKIEKAIKIFDLNEFYFTSSQVAEKFKQKYPDKKIFWLPEAVKTDNYSFKPFSERSIDVLSFGRKYEPYHEQIKNKLNDLGINYLYQKDNEPLLLPTKSIFEKVIEDSKINICFPGSITDPKKYQGIETVTWRYFQCMSAKNIILGKAPKELVELFGYNPVIDIDEVNPVNQIIEILNNPEKHLQLVEKNYNTTKLHNQWKNRILTIKNNQ